MDIKQIQDLIRFVSKSGVNEVAIEQKDFKITIKTNQAPTYVTANIPSAHPAYEQAPAIASSAPATTETAPTAAPVADTSHYITVKSPMIGTFYRSSTPEKPMFVNVGDEIKPGTVLCIIEAMKVMNEIKAEIRGTIAEIVAENGKPVQFGQVLFRVR